VTVAAFERLHHHAGVSGTELLDLDDPRLQHGSLHGNPFD
jgi:hypothetical protein